MSWPCQRRNQARTRPAAAGRGPCPTGSPSSARPARAAPDRDRSRSRRVRPPVVRRGDLVDHLGVRLERAVAVQEARRDPELLPVLRAQHGADMPAVGRRAAPDIDRDVPDRAAHHAHQLALRVRRDLQCSPRTTPRSADTRVIVLHERTRRCRPRRSGAAFQVSEKKPRGVEEARRRDQQHIGNRQVGSTIMPVPPRPVPSAPGRVRSCRDARACARSVSASM